MLQKYCSNYGKTINQSILMYYDNHILKIQDENLEVKKLKLRQNESKIHTLSISEVFENCKVNNSANKREYVIMLNKINPSRDLLKNPGLS